MSDAHDDMNNLIQEMFQHYLQKAYGRDDLEPEQHHQVRIAFICGAMAMKISYTQCAKSGDRAEAEANIQSLHEDLAEVIKDLQFAYEQPTKEKEKTK